jgi:nucleotide-binding universal stress UspA family protein
MYARILVPVDGSPTSEAGLVEAIRLARMSGGRILLLHVAEGLPYLPESATYGVCLPDANRAAVERGAELLKRCRALVAADGVEVDTALFEDDGRHLEDYVADQVKAGNADVVVIGTHGRRGIGRLLLGSDAEQVVRTATVPVLLVRHRKSGPAAGDAPHEAAAETLAG